jgi:hypothetical protein
MGTREICACGSVIAGGRHDITGELYLLETRNRIHLVHVINP